RPGAVAQDAGGMRLVHGALQRLGAWLLLAFDGRRSTAQEAGDRGVGPQDPRPFLGDAARQEVLARPADRAEGPVVAVQTPCENGGGRAASSEASAAGTAR